MEQNPKEFESRLERIEALNRILTEQLHGTGSSSSTVISFAASEAKILREIVEEIRVAVTSLNTRLTNIERKQQVEAERISNIIAEYGIVDVQESEESVDEDSDEVDVEMDDDSDGVEVIRSKTLEEEENCLKEKFQEERSKGVIKDGVSLEGRTVETISDSIPLGNGESSCVLKLSNFLCFPVTDSKFYDWTPTRMSGPDVVAGHFAEVFMGSGHGSSCDFLCSFRITNSLRLALRCGIGRSGGIIFAIGFIPQNVPTDKDLYWKLLSIPLSPDVVRKEPWMCPYPTELFVTTRQFLVRGKLRSDEPRAFVEVDILEMTGPGNGPLRNIRVKKMPSNLKRVVENISSSLNRQKEIPGRMSVSVEVVNLLNVTLRMEEQFYWTSGLNNFIATRVLSFKGVTFFASDDTEFEGMFSFGIECTDLCLVVGFKIQGTDNRFTAAFLPGPAPLANKQELEELMNENHWKSHEWRNSSQAMEREQFLEIRNIRALISMTEGERSLIKIQVFAF